MKHNHILKITLNREERHRIAESIILVDKFFIEITNEKPIKNSEIQKAYLELTSLKSILIQLGILRNAY